MSIRMKKILVAVLSVMLAGSLIYALTDRSTEHYLDLTLQIPFRVRQEVKTDQGTIFRNKVFIENLNQNIKSVTVLPEELSETGFNELKQRYSSQSSDYAKVNHNYASMFYARLDSGPLTYVAYIRRASKGQAWQLKTVGLSGEEVGKMLRKIKFD